MTSAEWVSVHPPALEFPAGVVYNSDMNEELLTVAQAADRLGTTIPRLRRLLARPDMAALSQIVPVTTLRGTRTSMVVPVSELPRLSEVLQGNEPILTLKKQEQSSGITFSEVEFTALQTTLRRTEELLVSKNQELAAKEQIIVLLREKITELEQPSLAHFREQERKQFVSVPEKDFRLVMPKTRLNTAADKPRQPPKREVPPKTAWARFYKWFREA